MVAARESTYLPYCAENESSDYSWRDLLTLVR